MYYLLESIEQNAGKSLDPEMRDRKRELTEVAVRTKQDEFEKFNVELAAALTAVLDALEPHYSNEEKRLRAFVQG